jgi:DNA-binding protein HU-beta
MNRQELINKIAVETDFQKNEIEKMLLSMLGIIQERVKSGEDVTLSDFGSFTPTVRKARQGFNPHTGKAQKFPEVRLVKFTVGKEFKKKLNGK